MKHKLDINLDDQEERTDFLNAHGTTKGRRLANMLGLRGEGSSRLATALSNYAWNAETASKVRASGEIQTAIMYEEIADRIYSRAIQPVCDCW